jgi:hypothetical protein
MTSDPSWGERNAPADADTTRRVRALAGLLAREHAARGARAVLLSGSWARGDARRHSDIDLWVIGARTLRTTRLRQGFLVSVRESTAASELRDMRKPGRAGQVVLAWREAIALSDPRGVAARLQRRARAFRWGPIARAADRYVASQLVEWSEEAVKLTRLMADGARETAAVQRNHLAIGMAGLVAVRMRLFYHETQLWEEVGARMDRGWHEAQRSALMVSNRNFESSCEAALELYRRTGRFARRCFTAPERTLIEHTCRAIGHPL